MKKLLSSLLVFAMLTSLTSGIIVSAADYSDVSGHWAETAINELSAKDILKGYNGRFSPDDFIKRGDVALILDRMYSLSEHVRANNNFPSSADIPDLTADAYYTDAMIYAIRVGVLRGDSLRYMRPEEYVTREEYVVMLDRTLTEMNYFGKHSRVIVNHNPMPNDYDKISDWARDGVIAAMEIGIIKGDPSGNFNPQNNLTRAEIATIAYNAMNMDSETTQTPAPAATVDSAPIPMPTVTTNVESLTGYEDPKNYESNGWSWDRDRYNKVIDGYYYTQRGYKIEEADYNDMLAKRTSIYSKVIKNGMSDFEKIKAIHDWISENNAYVDRDSATWESVKYEYAHQLAWAVLMLGKSVCAGYADAFQFLMDGLGIECHYVSGSNHAWNIVKLDGDYYHVDVTFDNPFVNGTQEMQYKNFLVSDLLRSGQINWDRSYYPECPKLYPFDRGIAFFYIDGKGYVGKDGSPLVNNKVYYLDAPGSVNYYDGRGSSSYGGDLNVGYWVLVDGNIYALYLSYTAVTSLQEGETYRYRYYENGDTVWVLGKVVDGYWVEDTVQPTPTPTPPPVPDIKGKALEEAIKLLEDTGMPKGNITLKRYWITLDESQHQQVRYYKETKPTGQGYSKIDIESYYYLENLIGGLNEADELFFNSIIGSVITADVLDALTRHCNRNFGDVDFKDVPGGITPAFGQRVKFSGRTVKYCLPDGTAVTLFDISNHDKYEVTLVDYKSEFATRPDGSMEFISCTYTVIVNVVEKKINDVSEIKETKEAANVPDAETD